MVDETLARYAYAPRPIRFLGIRAVAEWRVKAYAIAARVERPADAALDAAWRLAAEGLPRPALASGRHGVGFLTVHAGVQGLWVLLNWWAHGDALKHRHYFAPEGDPAALRCTDTEDFGPDMWDLTVQGYEKSAWMRHVLDNPDGPDLDAYLADGLSARI